MTDEPRDGGEADPKGPLSGYRILDLTSIIMGPYATQILGDLGADVIAVESARGDTNRIMGAGPHRQLSGIALNLLRNKRNIAIDLKDEAGREVVLKIIRSCDALVTNLRPGPLQRLRLTYDDVRAVRHDIVFCQAHGFPSESDRSGEPAYDDIIQAESGIADLCARVDDEPRLAPTILADKVCGLTVAYAVLAALLHRERTGRGQRIEVPMVDVARSFTLVEHGAGAIPEPPLGPVGYQRILTPNRRPQRTADGWIQMLPYEREHYDALFKAAGRDDLVGDSRYANGRARIANAHDLYAILYEIAADRSTSEWLGLCREHGIPAAAVATLDELVAELPIEHHPVAGAYRLIPSPVRFSETPAQLRRHAPLIGEHSHEVLRETGMSDDEYESLVARGVVRQPPPTR